jgi:DNA topoisomerase-2
VPWYKGYKGSITRADSGQVTFKGTFEKISSTKLRITELPVGQYQDDYKEFLNELVDKNIIKDYENNSADSGWNWTIDVPREVGHLEDEEILRKFKLVARESENFTVWLPDGKIKKFDTAESVCDYFIEFRLTKYEVRRTAMMVDLQNDLDVMNEKIRFIRYYIDNSAKVAKKTKAELEALLASEGFKRIEELLNIRIYNLTKDQIEKLEEQIGSTTETLKYYTNTTAKDLYIKDLKELKF